MKEIRVAIAGIGNCASNFIQGIEYYKQHPSEGGGLMHKIAGGYDITDIRVCAAFDISASKVGKDLSEAIFTYPNCTDRFAEVQHMGVKVHKGPVLDGWGEHFKGYIEVSEEKECDIKTVLEQEKIDVLVIMIPTGSKEACYKYAREALSSGVSVVNGIPVLLSHDQEIVELAEHNHAAIIGDDFKSQIGGTILHHTLMDLLNKRGITVTDTYQLNYAGNTDFLNLMTKRGTEKHESKKRGVLAGSDNINMDVNVSYLKGLKDNKTCRIHVSGENFGGCRIILDCELKVVDSANSSGVLCDAVRCLKVARDKGVYGRLEAPSAYYMKSPYKQLDDTVAFELVNKFLND